MLQNGKQSEWNDKDLEKSFVARLGNIREPFLELAQWANTELSKIEDKLNGFEELIQLTEEVGWLLTSDDYGRLIGYCRAAC